MSERTRVRRLPKKAVGDRSVLNSILDSALIAHVAIIDGNQPYAIPVGCARDGDRLLMHGSNASRLFKLLSSGVPCCASITLLDGVVLARTSFESSMHYRSAMILGSAVTLSGVEKVEALEVLTEHFQPGRLAEIRKSNDKELSATTVVALSLDEFSIKISATDPEDLPEDLSTPIWAGVVPMIHKWGTPRAAGDLEPGIAPPQYLANWPTGRA
ncbi:MAG TPA: pyridoxamine 5'-phosphate oxidase family protein [Candidatus Nanopelagicaceae bacterium]|nr:pyridoxamine 5'-phosphate oxidase family protein [Candidatus Nanopelagicaceae bacterium]